ncbi:DUF2254 domain-containing protein [Lentzea sp. HUAS12]|uniref:DUF2254 domain-containing protein n=1 Tax=Lentzea sp. HUAS12 TaxID=2951806 RepID=UPI00209CEF75|nr:DUF2254 domain-containing protein [Lentzea sp. HUAS12]USX53349.1 DUF2254 domain-containing protein [Lentzea sp. HUAS12]
MPSLRTRHRLRGELWIVPLLCVLAAIALSTITVAIDRSIGDRMIPTSITGKPDAVSTILSTIASAMVTLTTLVLTITTVAVQLAMGQFSPRIVRALLQDRASQLAYGLFASTFTFAVLALRELDVAGGGTVPGLTVLVAYLLMLASIATLFLYMHHSGNSLRAAGLIDLVGDHLHEQIDRLYTSDDSTPAPRDVVVCPESGIVVDLDRPALVAAAHDAGCVLELVPMMGDFVPAGAPLFRIRGDAARLDHGQLAGLVVLAAERTHGDDPAYGFRKLVDIAERGIAQPFTDPTTTVMVIDRLHDALRQLATRSFPTGRHDDAHGDVRLTERVLGWDGYVRLAFDELRLAGVASPQVPRRIFAALHDLKAVAPPQRHPALDRQLSLLTSAVEHHYDDGPDRRAALVPDQQGVGSGADLSGPPQPAGRSATPSPNGRTGSRG